MKVNRKGVEGTEKGVLKVKILYERSLLNRTGTKDLKPIPKKVFKGSESRLLRSIFRRATLGVRHIYQEFGQSYANDLESSSGGIQIMIKSCQDLLREPD